MRQIFDELNIKMFNNKILYPQNFEVSKSFSGYIRKSILY